MVNSPIIVNETLGLSVQSMLPIGCQIRCWLGEETEADVRLELYFDPMNQGSINAHCVAAFSPKPILSQLA